MPWPKVRLGIFSPSPPTPGELSGFPGKSSNQGGLGSPTCGEKVLLGPSPITFLVLPRALVQIGPWRPSVTPSPWGLCANYPRSNLASFLWTPSSLHQLPLVARRRLLVSSKIPTVTYDCVPISGQPSSKVPLPAEMRDRSGTRWKAKGTPISLDS